MRQGLGLALAIALSAILTAPAASAQAPAARTQAPAARTQAPAARTQKVAAADLGDKQRDLRQAQKRLNEERQKAADARKREAGLLAELETIDKRVTDKKKQVAVLDGRIKRAQSDVAELSADIARLGRQRVGQEEALERRLRALYKIEAQGGALPLLLSGDDPVAKAVQLRHLATLATVDARLIREYRVTSEGLAEKKTRFEARQNELTSLRAEAEEERAEAGREVAKRQGLLAKVKDERAYHDRVVGELSEATKRLEVFIRELQEKQRRAAAQAAAAAKAAAAKASPPSTGPGPRLRTAPPPIDATPGTGFAALRGRLAWPADGRVVAEYGAQVHPRFGTKTFRNGIDIDVAEGTTITAVAPGHVLYTGWFRGYGNLIIVDHGGEYFTLYAHAANITVNEGDEVRQGQVIGTVGDTGSLQGPRLYFEVRHAGRPQDPANWLRPRG